MEDWKIIGVLSVILIGIALICGCSNTANTKSTVTASGTETTTTQQDCIINNDQKGHIEILGFNYASALKRNDGSYIFPVDDKRLFGKAKNVGTNTISGTIDYTDSFTDDNGVVKKIIRKYSYKFCNIEPNQEFDFIIPDEKLTVAEKNNDDCCRWTLNAGENITTTGEGPRGNPS
jgi:hypothetical protein